MPLKMNGRQRILTQRSVANITPDGDRAILEMDETGFPRDRALLGKDGRNKKGYRSDKKYGFRHSSI